MMRHALWLSALAACGTSDGPPGGDTDTTAHTDPPVADTDLPAEDVLAPLDLLARTSLDLRGIRPSLDEIAAVEADPAALDSLIDNFLASPRFGRRVREIYDEIFLTRDEAPFAELAYLEEVWSIPDLSRSIGEEPTRILEHIANAGLPLTAFVTGDWTMANEVTADIFPVDYPPGQTGWQVAHYTDQRPAAGALSTNGLWWQHGSMLNNLNRGRANQFSRIFLCFDYLNAQIDFTGVSALDSEQALGDAIRTDPACASCHDTLDPLAAHFYGFWYFTRRLYDPYDTSAYHPERERAWADLGGLPPAFHGAPTTGLADLGRRTAADPAFSQCFATRSWEGLMRRTATNPERRDILDHDAVFRRAELDVRTLYADIVRSPAYRSGAGVEGRKLASAAVLSSQIEALTGFVWAESGWDLVRAPLLGFGPMAGAVDHIHRAEPLREPSTTLALVHKRLAEAAATYVVDHDLSSGSPTLLTQVDGQEDPTSPDGEAAIRDQIATLHARILTQPVPPDGPIVDALWALWQQTHVGPAPGHEAWSAVITVLLRDPRLVVY